MSVNNFEIKQLPEKFKGKGEVSGFRFECVKRGNNAFIYKVDAGHRPYYEVFKKRISRTRYGDGYVTLYPKSNSFGLWAMSTQTYERALMYFDKYENSKPYKLPS